MIIRQISVLLKDKTCRFADTTRILAENDINISVLSNADAAEFCSCKLQ